MRMDIESAKSFRHRVSSAKNAWHSHSLTRKAQLSLQYSLIATHFCIAFDSNTGQAIKEQILSHLFS